MNLYPAFFNSGKSNNIFSMFIQLIYISSLNFLFSSSNNLLKYLIAKFVSMKIGLTGLPKENPEKPYANRILRLVHFLSILLYFVFL